MVPVRTEEARLTLVDLNRRNRWATLEALPRHSHNMAATEQAQERHRTDPVRLPLSNSLREGTVHRRLQATAHRLRSHSKPPRSLALIKRL